MGSVNKSNPGVSKLALQRVNNGSPPCNRITPALCDLMEASRETFRQLGLFTTIDSNGTASAYIRQRRDRKLLAIRCSGGGHYDEARKSTPLGLGNMAQHFEAIELEQHQVEGNRMNFFAPQNFKRAFAIVRRAHLITMAHEAETDHFAHDEPWPSTTNSPSIPPVGLRCSYCAAAFSE